MRLESELGEEPLVLSGVVPKTNNIKGGLQNGKNKHDE